MTNNKKTAIVTGGTKDQFPAMAVLALNIADKCPNIADELIIFHDGIPTQDQEKLSKIFPTRFIEYNNPFEEEENFNETVTNYFSFMVFCKYECWRLLEEYSCVIWCDYDLIFLKDVQELKIKTNSYAKFIQDCSLVKKFNSSLFWKYEEDALKMNLFYKGICACLFVLYDDFPDYLVFYDKCIDYTKKYSKTLYLPEEAIISLLFSEYNYNYSHIDGHEYALQPSKEDINILTKGIHSCGQPKFWNGLENEKWNEYYDIWVNQYKGMAFINNKETEEKKCLWKKIIKCLLPYGVVRLYQRLKDHGK